MDHAVAMEMSAEQCQLLEPVDEMSGNHLSDHQDHEHEHDKKLFQVLFNAEAK